MTVDNSFTMKKFQSMEIIYVSFSQITKLPYVECDPETFDDQVYMFTEEEAAKEEPRKLRYVLRDLAVAENAFAYEYTGYLSNIHSVKAYFDANLDMLESQKFYSLFAPNQKVYTKVKNEEPTYYAASSDVKVSQFASGSLVRGKVDHSVVSRNVDLSEGSTVNHAVIFPRVEVGKNATVEYAIVDKGVKIADGVTIRGTENNPVVIKKGSVVTEDIVR